ncbi:MAG: hypothetical protein AAF960_00205 [Bacteroidota bacterium]
MFLQRLLFGVAPGSFLLKISIQALTIIPALAMLSFTIKSYLIGFLHLLLLGLLTTALLGMALRQKWLVATAPLRMGIFVFLVGITVSEGLLFVQGTLFALGWGMIPYYWGLFLGSICLPLGVLLVVVFSQFKQHSELVVAS